MDRWRGRVAVVTGASAGIGAGIVQALLKHGMVVVGVARRAEKVEALASPRYPGKLHAVKCDVSKEEDILQTFRWVKEKLGKVDVLVNNAGLFGESRLTEASTEELRRLLDVNVLGLTLCTREAVKIMREKGIDDGHIFHISSVSGHWLPELSEGAMYHATKHAVRVLAEGLRKEFLQHKSNTRITEISPGLVETDIFDNMKHFTRDQVFSLPTIRPEDVADCVVFALGAPTNVQVFQLMVMPVKQMQSLKEAEK